MARKSKKSKGSKKARAGKSGAKKSTAKKSSAKKAAQEDSVSVESVDTPTAEAATSEKPAVSTAATEEPRPTEEPEAVDTTRAADPKDEAEPKPAPTKKKRTKSTGKKSTTKKVDSGPEAGAAAPLAEPEVEGAEPSADPEAPAQAPPEDPTVDSEPAPKPKKKKKKKRGRKSKAKKQESDESGPVEVAEPKAEPQPVASAEPVAAVPPKGQSEPVVISIDDDLDDHDTRERLIAEALAFVAAEEGEAPPEATLPDTGERAEVGIDFDTTHPAAPEGANGADEPLEVDADSEGEEDRPRLSPDALLALSEMRSQGMTLPGELILDLGEATTPQERDRLLAAAMAHAEMQEAIYRIPMATRHDTWIKAGIASALLFVALIVGVWPPGLLVPEPPRTLTERDAIAGVRDTLLLQAQQIEAFRVNADRLPTSLEEAGAPFDGIRYVRSGNRLYQLVAYAPDGEPLIYDSAAPAPELQALARSWNLSGDGS